MFAKNIILNSDGSITQTNSSDDAKELLVISKEQKINDKIKERIHLETE